MTDTHQDAALLLRGDAFERGRLQAELCPDQVPAVRSAVASRLQALAQPLQRPAVARFLADQWDFSATHDAPGLAETRGIAQGFGIAPESLFAYLHLNVVADLAQGGSADGEGCSAWAAQAGSAAGCWVVKNRDYRGEHGALQRVFAHEDPAWQGRRMLCVGSLGSPGAFSSGINSDGLAVVDTQIASRDHGTGWLRYFLMNRLLRACASVDEALRLIAGQAHAGGGTLVLGDAQGQVAAVELGHTISFCEPARPDWTARTNHFLAPQMLPAMLNPADDALSDSSPGRLRRLRQTLQDRPQPLALDDIRQLMAGHLAPDAEALCRHAQGNDARTLSTSIYRTRMPTLVMSHGNPCQGRWHTYALSDVFG